MSIHLKQFFKKSAGPDAPANPEPLASTNTPDPLVDEEQPDDQAMADVPDPLGDEEPIAKPTAVQGQLPHQKKGRDGLKSIIATVAIIVIAPLIAYSLTTFIFQSYEVDGESMETTLQNQDRLIVLKAPRTVAKITGHQYLPNRGDVIIFNLQELDEFAISGKKQLVKRVIGLPGDRVVVNGGAIKIFNSDHPSGFSPDKTMPYGSVIKTTSGNMDLTVPAGEIFVAGDNRGNSLDSRVFGPISLNDVVGKLAIRIFPFNKVKVF